MKLAITSLLLSSAFITTALSNDMVFESLRSEFEHSSDVSISDLENKIFTCVAYDLNGRTNKFTMKSSAVNDTMALTSYSSNSSNLGRFLDGSLITFQTRNTSMFPDHYVDVIRKLEGGTLISEWSLESSFIKYSSTISGFTALSYAYCTENK